MKKVEKNNHISNGLYILKHSLKFDKGFLINLIVYSVMVSVIPFLSTILSKVLIDDLLAHSQFSRIIAVLLGFLLIGLLTQGISPYIRSVYEPKLMYIREKFLQMLNLKTMQIDYTYIESPEIGDRLKLAMRAVADNQVGIESILNKVFSGAGIIITILLYGYIIARSRFFLVLLLVVISAIVFFITNKTKEFELKNSTEYVNKEREKNYFYDVMSDFSYGKDIRAYKIQDYLISKYDDICKKLINVKKRINIVYMFGDASINLLKTVGIIISYGVFIIDFSKTKISAGDFFLYTNSAIIFSTMLVQLYEIVSDIMMQSHYIDDYRQYMELEEYESDSGEQIDSIRSIEFINVSFKYPNSDKMILKNVSFKITGSEKIALVGLNGAGKTTLVKLICGFYKPTSGKILINDIEVEKISKHSYIKCISALFQDYNLFSFSINENISGMDSEESKQKTKEVVEELGIYDWIKKLPKELDTTIFRIIDEEGVNLSGGQSQKVALARTMYKRANVILLDEPTAALDAIAEEQLYKEFNELVKDRMVIFISHRLSSTRFCDRIISIEDGGISEIGSHECLMEQKGRYYQLFKLQAEKYDISKN